MGSPLKIKIAFWSICMMPQNSHVTLACSIYHNGKDRGPQPSLICMCLLITDFSTTLGREIVLSIQIPKLPESYAAFYFLRGRRFFQIHSATISDLWVHKKRYTFSVRSHNSPSYNTGNKWEWMAPCKIFAIDILLYLLYTSILACNELPCTCW